jgi:hypothetical protein
MHAVAEEASGEASEEAAVFVAATPFAGSWVVKESEKLPLLCVHLILPIDPNRSHSTLSLLLLLLLVVVASL